MRARNGSEGFTLIELIVVVVLMAIFSAIAIPSFTTFINNNRVQSASNEFYGLLVAARSEAVTRRAPVSLSGTSSGLWSTAVSGTALGQIQMPTGISVSTSLTSQTFRPDGTAASGSYLVCRGNDPTSSYKILVTATGNPRLLPRGKDESNQALVGCQ